jgi:hypothetical protein
MVDPTVVEGAWPSWEELEQERHPHSDHSQAALVFEGLHLQPGQVAQWMAALWEEHDTQVGSMS